MSEGGKIDKRKGAYLFEKSILYAGKTVVTELNPHTELSVKNGTH